MNGETISFTSSSLRVLKFWFKKIYYNWIIWIMCSRRESSKIKLKYINKSIKLLMLTRHNYPSDPIYILKKYIYNNAVMFIIITKSNKYIEYA